MREPILKEKDKPRRQRARSLKAWRKDCDTLMQKINRKENPNCLVCGRPTDTGHHFFPKSTSARLRYEFDNLIPICNGCHMQHHQAGNPRIHQTIIQRKGIEWYERLNKLSREVISVGVGYYKEVKERLKLLI